MLQKDISDSCRNRLNNSITTINLSARIKNRSQMVELSWYERLLQVATVKQEVMKNNMR